MLTSVAEEIGTATGDTVRTDPEGGFAREPRVGTLEDGGASPAAIADSTVRGGTVVDPPSTPEPPAT